MSETIAAAAATSSEHLDQPSGNKMKFEGKTKSISNVWIAVQKLVRRPLYERQFKWTCQLSASMKLSIFPGRPKSL
jgi:hypothetical protein